jgi:hypothetical protein
MKHMSGLRTPREQAHERTALIRSLIRSLGGGKPGAGKQLVVGRGVLPPASRVSIALDSTTGKPDNADVSPGAYQKSYPTRSFHTDFDSSAHNIRHKSLKTIIELNILLWRVTCI